MENYDSILNNKELDFIKDTDFLITKHSVSDKIYSLLRDVEHRLQLNIKVNNLKFPAKVLLKAGKISKGENYRLLPYLILDYPRYFHPEAVFAFRTMFWWGNFFSCTLHLQGTLLNNYRSDLENELENLIVHNFFIAVSDNPWEYHYNDDNYKLMNKINKSELKDMIKGKSFIKLSRYISLEEHQYLPFFAEETFNLVMKSIRISK